MKEQALITLTSDFGLQDGYVGIIKGVIAGIAPHARTIDLNHQISPQDLYAGRFILLNAYQYFPQGTIHLAVIDPGVGSKRRGVGIRFAGGYLVGPDNGLFSGILSQSPAISAVNLNNSSYWRTPNPSTTFHGRGFPSAEARVSVSIPPSTPSDHLAILTSQGLFFSARQSITHPLKIGCNQSRTSKN